MTLRNSLSPAWRRHNDAIKGVAASLPFLLVGCVAVPEFASGSERTALIEAFRTQSERATVQQDARERVMIQRLLITETEGVGLTLSIGLENADLGQVISRILVDPRIQFRAESLSFRKRISARFENKPLIDGLNTLLQGTGVTARVEEGIVLFQKIDMSATAQALSSALVEPDRIVSDEVTLKHLAADDVLKLLSDLYAVEEDGDGPPFTVSSVPELNAVYVSGAAQTVASALRVVEQADRPVSHVIIEVLVVDIDTSSVEALGIDLSGGADGNFSAASIIPSQVGGNIVATFQELASNSAQVTATVDFLAAQNVAQVLARPYVATRSTRPATVEIVMDQFARVDSTSDDASITTTDSITAGITLNMTPIVMAGNRVRLDVAVEDSRFGATAGDIVIAKERNSASTSMIVGSGQTIIMGGLNSRYRISENSGLPWLRKVPILNAFAAKQGAFETRKELVVYLTPYVWHPGLDLPLPLPDGLTAQLPGMTSLEGGN